MQIDYFVLADAVAVAEGKHYIHGGGWDALWVRSFPAIHPGLGVAVRLRLPWEESNQQLALEADLVEGETKSSILPEPIRGIVNAERPPYVPPGGDLLLHLALTFTNLQFEYPGTYTVVLRIDGEPLAESRFNVIHLPEP